MKPVFDLSLYLVAGPSNCRNNDVITTVMQAIEGGVTIVQLRDKTMPDSDFITLGQKLHSAMQGTNVPLIINDRVNAALEIGAEGVHIGTTDMPPAEARAILGPDRIIGTSVDETGAASLPEPAFVDYVGIGPVHATGTKTDHDPPIGYGGLARIYAASKVPAVAIGGLIASDVEPVLATGVQGLCVVSAICNHEDPRTAARTLRNAIKEARP